MTPRHDTKAVTKETGARFSKALNIFRAKKLFLVNRLCNHEVWDLPMVLPVQKRLEIFKKRIAAEVGAYVG